MKIRTKIAALSLAGMLPLLAACSAASDDSAESGSDVAVEAVADDGTAGGTAADGEGAADGTAPDGAPQGAAGGPGMAVDPDAVTTEDELIELVQQAYGDASLGLHRGHQPVEQTLIDVLGITHDEMHVRMEEQGQNLAAVAEDLGIDPQTLIDALVDSWSPAIDGLVSDGTISADEGEQYLDALEEAFTYRVTWDGQEATPTFTGIGS
ncbi:hypothetical protein [Myceligenerans indicum]|uniref:Lipoprotein n=1 Tax=Myceligenerans indicum TaxID=2593663 RepID=A0ABS1LM64_9MICO|nr:hypothetical protein [Myceligenerans indicum]MBL0887258.1 hypothetical protein [Myceligenerans indicum]